MKSVFVMQYSTKKVEKEAKKKKKTREITFRKKVNFFCYVISHSDRQFTAAFLDT